MVRGRPLLRSAAGGLRMLRLSGYWPGMPAICGRLFLRRGARLDPALTAVVADAAACSLVHPSIVNIADGSAFTRLYAVL